MNLIYTPSQVRTSKLWCSGCKTKIKQGSEAVFALRDGAMEAVYGPCCGDQFVERVEADATHPHDLD